MERESNQMQPMCRSGCGFFGNPATEGLCSKCFKESLKKKQQPPASSAQSSTSSYLNNSVASAINSPSLPYQSSTPCRIPVVSAANLMKEVTELKETAASGSVDGSPATSVCGGDTDDTNSDGKEPTPKKKTRCVTCRKKLGLTGFECRCGGMYCSAHRYSDKHSCTFDYRELGAQEIRRNNPVVVGEKIQKI